LKDKNPYKVNLGIGVYKTENEEICLFDSIKMAQREILKDEINKNYIDMIGSNLFNEQTAKLIFGKESQTIKNQSVSLYLNFIKLYLQPFLKISSNNIFKYKTLQTLGGTGALFLGTMFLVKYLKNVFVS